ncbi:DUF1642 domain-containing protein [Lactococcus lactis]|jgi:hypothetical protein|uniref:DUF1642 domain-containing protein n=1 Tax=Lactococcus lactis TaxID=1358 RepID=A0AAW5TSB8_9LACT|nr:DUF1642 domain-containing protein [Lactococcus lactis]MCT3093025.1 DUF1642 domain-containing protein [Lactococcus lactis]MCW2281728.1 hypothetical protein [Lactococcus lactis]
MTKTFEEEAIKEAKKCRVVMNAYDGESNPPKAGLNLKLGWATHNFPWLEFAKNWHSDEEFQELLNKYCNLNDNYEKEVVRSSKLESQINELKSQLQQQALPVVPEFVDRFLKSKPIFNIVKYPIPIEIISWANKQTGYMDLEINITYLIKLKTNGYQVEKPQLFYLKNKLTGDCLAICLARASSGLYVEVTEKWLTRKEQTSYKLYFTQQEIGSMETGSYEQIEVAE